MSEKIGGWVVCLCCDGIYLCGTNQSDQKDTKKFSYIFLYVSRFPAAAYPTVGVRAFHSVLCERRRSPSATNTLVEEVIL
jgi:hypothetical protein